MNNQSVLMEARATLEETRALLAELDAAPAFVRNNHQVRQARAVAMRSRALVIELVRRVRADIEGGNHGNGTEAGAGLPAVS